MTWGDKFSEQEVNDAFSEFKIEDGQIDAGHLKGLMVWTLDNSEKKKSPTENCASTSTNAQFAHLGYTESSS